jgi:hypothetical protein
VTNFRSNETKEEMNGEFEPFVPRSHGSLQQLGKTDVNQSLFNRLCGLHISSRHVGKR